MKNIQRYTIHIEYLQPASNTMLGLVFDKRTNDIGAFVHGLIVGFLFMNRPIIKLIINKNPHNYE